MRRYEIVFFIIVQDDSCCVVFIDIGSGGDAVAFPLWMATPGSDLHQEIGSGNCLDVLDDRLWPTVLDLWVIVFVVFIVLWSNLIINQDFHLGVL